jgi:hypothetical protein
MALQFRQENVMRLRLSCVTLLIAALCATGCAWTRGESRGDATGASDGLPGRAQCVHILYIENWEILDTSTLLVYAPQPHLVKLSEAVPGLSSQDGIGFFAGKHNDQICGVAGDQLVRTPEPKRVPIIATRIVKAGEVKQLKASSKRTVASGGVSTPDASAAPTSAAPTSAAPNSH